MLLLEGGEVCSRPLGFRNEAVSARLNSSVCLEMENPLKTQNKSPLHTHTNPTTKEQQRTPRLGTPNYSQ